MQFFQEIFTEELMSDATRFEEFVQTTLSASQQLPDTTTETEVVSKTDFNSEEEEVITETSMAMSIGK
jgi:hypothetical protein